MKQILFAGLLSLLFLTCDNDKNQYTINGTAKGYEDGTKVILQGISERGEEELKDTAIINDEKFMMKGSVAHPEVNFLKVGKSSNMLTFMLENSDIDITINKENIIASEITGSATQDDMDEFQSGFKAIIDKSREVVLDMRNTDHRTEKEKRDSLSKIIKKYGDEILALPLQFVQKNNDSYFSLNLVGLEANKPTFDVKRFKAAFDNFTPELKASPKGIEISKKLDSLYTEYKKVEHLDIGKIAPNFEATTPKGKTISLDAIKGKVTIIDFWAAWCKPCRMENPKVVKLYNDYKSEGLEIIGVSLDGAPNQENPMKAWIDAIEEDQLTWHQVSNLDYFSGPIAQLYHINAIPATYILDANGSIVAKNLRGELLRKKVEELLYN
ncbi:MAG: AhpC/TSA family protein [Winogradskyella sp.]|uniref:redoxin domain-containing protein n=1 Tax=Winogradskyella sp. TaxID=1883156 RepID=UPI0018398EA0|nr:AhpC/TSA family protein [Winogradskyella sp.]